MQNEAAVDFLEMCRHETLATNIASASMVRHNVRAAIQNARIYIEPTMEIDNAFARLARAADTICAEADNLVIDQAQLSPLKKIFENALDHTVDLIREAKPSDTARALGVA